MASAVPAFLDEHVAIGEGERPAIVTPSGAVTYAQLLDALPRTATGKGQRFALKARIESR
jgi:hypothetical protein